VASSSPKKAGHARSRTLEFDKVVGARLRAYRKELGLSQPKFAIKLAISPQQLQKYETGVNKLSFGRAIEVADLLGISLAELGGLGEMPRSTNGKPVRMSKRPTN